MQFQNVIFFFKLVMHLNVSIEKSKITSMELVETLLSIKKKKHNFCLAAKHLIILSF